MPLLIGPSACLGGASNNRKVARVMCAGPELLSKQKIAGPILLGLLLLVFTAQSVSAGEKRAVLDEKTSWITLGTHGGPLVGLRAQPSNALVVNGAVYIVDAGNGVAGQVVKAGLKIANISAIFISHNHDDHNADMGTLAGLAYTAGRIKPLVIYGPPGTKRAMAGFAQFYSVNAEIRMSEFGLSKPFGAVVAVHESSVPGIVYKDANVTVTAVENDHFHFPPGSPAFGKDQSFAYRFETKHRIYVYTGDTGPSASVTMLAQNADVLISEVINIPAALRSVSPTSISDERSVLTRQNVERHLTNDHLSGAEVGKMARIAHVKAVVLTHLVPEVADSDVYDTFVDGVRKEFNGPVFVARDLVSY